MRKSQQVLRKCELKKNYNLMSIFNERIDQQELLPNGGDACQRRIRSTQKEHDKFYYTTNLESIENTVSKINGRLTIVMRGQSCTSSNPWFRA